MFKSMKVVRPKHSLGPYRESNSPAGLGLKYPGESLWTYFYFEKNVQGDVIGLYRSDYSSSRGYYGTLVARYNYDPYGRPVSMTNASGTTISQTAYNVAAYNPFRYRGYRYDGETGLYYLQSRYYDPETCRFINADSYAGTGQGITGYNMFAYCNSNPICQIDVSGNAARPVTMLVNDGGSSSSVKTTVDGNEGSQALSDYIVDNDQIPESDTPVEMSVEFAGIYSKDTNEAVNLLLAGVGAGTTIAPLALKNTTLALAGGAMACCSVVGVALCIYTIISAAAQANDPLEDKDYYSYKVTMEWSETKPVNPESTIYTKTNYTSVSYLVWNDARIGRETWTSIGYSCNFTTETIEIPIR